jgi:hypothetical protein
LPHLCGLGNTNLDSLAITRLTQVVSGAILAHHAASHGRSARLVLPARSPRAVQPMGSWSMHYTSWNNLLVVLGQVLVLTAITRHMANHVVGVYNVGGTVTQDYNLFYGNITNTVGSVTGGLNNASGDPKFVNVADDDYHLSANSAAIDKGTNLGLPIDFDGALRPFRSGVDIGFDEYVPHFVYLPLVSK